MQVWRRALAAGLPALALLMATGVAPAAEKTIQRVVPSHTAAADVDDDGNARVIVKYRTGSSLAQSRKGAQRLGRQLQLTLQDGHVLGARSQSLRGRGIGAQALAARLAADPDVEWAQPVRRKSVRAVAPNDPLFADNQVSSTPVVGQWYLRAPDATLVSAVNAVGAWDITTGSAGITVAVLDTGVRFDHPDLANKLWPGYDFVSRNATAADGGGRDADPSDPGDWSTARDTCGVSNSSWHGTQVAGLIGAASDNGIGIAGTGRNTMVLPVRVLGKCGGYDDDIIAGMRWAGGLANAAGCSSGSSVSATCNPHPARVINMSLGSSGACSDAYQDAIVELTAAGVVVVASGNDTGHAVNEPANCPDALAVAGVRHAGTKVGYSNLGPQVAIAAPAGNCVNTTGACLYPLVTTLNAGTSAPGASTYSDSSDPSLGTSFATPIVAGSVALMLAVNPALTPAEVKTALQATARAFPVSGAQERGTVSCRAPDGIDQVECYCTTSTCGAGLLDVRAAVTQVRGTRPVARLTFDRFDLTVGDSVTALGQLSTAAIAGQNLRHALAVGGAVTALGQQFTTETTSQNLRHQWSVTNAAGAATITSSSNAADVTVQATQAGDFNVLLAVTDDLDQTATSSLRFVAVAPPTVSITRSAGTGQIGTTDTFDATGSSAGSSLRSISSYAWRIVSGQSAATIDGAADGVTVKVINAAVGSYVLGLTVTDSRGASSAREFAQVVAAEPVVVTPQAPSGGGGALGAGWLLALAAAVLLLWRAGPRPHSGRR